MTQTSQYNNVFFILVLFCRIVFISAIGTLSIAHLFRQITNYGVHAVDFSGRVKLIVCNSPFYSCVLSDLALAESEAGVDLVLIQTSLFFICRSCCSYANYFSFT